MLKYQIRPDVGPSSCLCPNRVREVSRDGETEEVTGHQVPGPGQILEQYSVHVQRRLPVSGAGIGTDLRPVQCTLYRGSYQSSGAGTGTDPRPV